MSGDVFQVMWERLDQTVRSHEEAIVRGSAKDHAEYREMCGVIRGLRHAQSELMDMRKTYLQDGDDD